MSLFRPNGLSHASSLEWKLLKVKIRCNAEELREKAEKGISALAISYLPKEISLWKVRYFRMNLNKSEGY